MFAEIRHSASNLTDSRRRTRDSIADSLLLIVALLALAFVAAGCGGGGNGQGGPLEFVDAVIDELGELPLENAFLNNAITVEFNSPVDPDSVSAQTFRVLEGPSFQQQVHGELVVEGRFVRFVPRLPTQEDLSDATFQPGKTYRVVLRGLPDLNTIRSKRGRPLLATERVSFSTKELSPYFIDPVPGPPRVVAVLIDLNGDGLLEADGDPATPEDEEFFEGEVDFDPTIPFLRDVHVGSSNLPTPNHPLKVAFLFSEPLLPVTVLRDSDRNGRPEAFEILDTTNPFACDEPNAGDFCDRPLDYITTFEQLEETSTQSPAARITLEIPYALATEARHRLVARLSLTDLRENPMTRTFRAVFETTPDRPTADFLIEDFSTKRKRHSATTALWNPERQTYLRAGIGFGGDGSDGLFTGIQIDTRNNDGIFNFTNIDTVSDISVIGDKPAIVRIFGTLEMFAGSWIRADGQPGARGVGDDTTPLPGGRAGPAGYVGGTASPDGSGSSTGGRGDAPPDSEGGGHGGISGSGPGGGGGGGHGETGGNGQAGREESGGEGGAPYGDPEFDILTGGAGGGAGGNNPTAPEGSPGNSGGSGGGGGGVLMIEALGNVAVPTAFPVGGFSVNGGSGGISGRSKSGNNTGGGGGGAGGMLWVRARDIRRGGAFEATGGIGGAAISPGGRGGVGADGLIRFELLSGSRTCGRCDPEPIVSTISEDIIGRSIGRSRFFSTHVEPGTLIEYEFDGSYATGPEAGLVRPGGTDITLLNDDGSVINSRDELSPDVTAEIFFRGAMEDSSRPDQPDPDTIGPWHTDISALTGMTMIQWEVRFDLGVTAPLTLDPEDDPPAIGVDDIRVRFRLP